MYLDDIQYHRMHLSLCLKYVNCITNGDRPCKDCESLGECGGRACRGNADYWQGGVEEHQEALNELT